MLNLKRWFIEILILSFVFTGLAYAAHETKFSGLRVSDLTASQAIFTDGEKDLVSTGTSEALLGSLSDETGTAYAVFSDAPTLTGIVVATDIDGSGTISGNLFTPDTADGGDLGSTSLEFSDLYLAASGIIYGENDQSNTLTSAATGWTANLNMAATTYGSDGSITDAELLGIDDGATTELPVGGGAGSAMVWTTATGTGAPVRAGSPTMSGTPVAPTIDLTGVTDTNIPYMAGSAAGFADSPLTTDGTDLTDSGAFTSTDLTTTGNTTLGDAAADTLTVNATVYIQAGQNINVTTVNAATYDLLTTDYVLNVTYTVTGPVTSLTLPTAQTVDGRIIHIKDAGGLAGTNSITVDTQGSETIDGNSTYVLNTNHEAISIYSDGTNWYVY